ncbi:MAG: hypothetical protein KF847_20750 [Pirellulales bacterium]|nr:hypothetical protein [Pirellulales bacterium]
MRRRPSSWTTTLTALGFRKVRRKGAAKRAHRFESLEVRQMLSATPIDEAFKLGGSDFVALAAPNPGTEFSILPPGAEKLEFAIVPDATGAVSRSLTVETISDADGALQAQVRVVGDAGEIAGQVHTVAIDLRAGSRTVERFEVKVLIAPEKFVSDLQADRLRVAGQIRANAQSVDASQDEVALARSVDLLIGDTNRGVSDDVRASAYDALREAATGLLAKSGAAERQSVAVLESSAVLVAASLAVDLASDNPAIAASAARLRDQLLETVGPAATIFAGLGRNRFLTRETVDPAGNEFALAAVEESTISLLGAIRIDLEGAVGYVQARRLPSSSYSLPLATGLVIDQKTPLADTSVFESAPAATAAGASAVLTVQGGAADARAFLQFDLASEVGNVLKSGHLDLQTLSASGGANSVTAYKDLFGVLSPGGPTGIWSENDLSWTSQAGTFTEGFSSTLDVKIPVAATETSFNVSEAVQRAVLTGDSNLTGSLDDGDVNSFYRAVREASSYNSMYSSQTSVANELLYRNDVNWDGVVNGADVAPMFLAGGERERISICPGGWILTITPSSLRISAPQGSRRPAAVTAAATSRSTETSISMTSSSSPTNTTSPAAPGANLPRIRS